MTQISMREQIKSDDSEIVKTSVAGADALVEMCHALAREAGWWDVRNGNDPMTNPYTFSNKLALVHSEISESLEGDRKGVQDDHLPQYPMWLVELADAQIRINDLLGARNVKNFGEVTMAKLRYNANRLDHTAAARAAAGGKSY